MDQEDEMMENGKRRKRRQLSPEEKWELFLEVTSQELSQADAARKCGGDVSVIIRLRALAKDAAMSIYPEYVYEVLGQEACEHGGRKRDRQEGVTLSV